MIAAHALFARTTSTLAALLLAGAVAAQPLPAAGSSAGRVFAAGANSHPRNRLLPPPGSQAIAAQLVFFCCDHGGYYFFVATRFELFHAQLFRLRLLSLVRMVGTRVNLQSLDHLERQLVLRQHAANGVAEDAIRMPV